MYKARTSKPIGGTTLGCEVLRVNRAASCCIVPMSTLLGLGVERKTGRPGQNGCRGSRVLWMTAAFFSEPEAEDT